MTVRKWFLKSSDTSAVTRLILVCVLLSMVGNAPHTCRGEFLERETRKLFGGYRITPSACKSRRSLNSRESNICMFNHECAQRGGEVVGSCMDGFLFGACCRLRSEAHIPKGPGVVMTSYLDYPDPELDTADYEAEQLNMWHNSFKPVVTPGYRPSSSSPRPEDLSTEAELINEGVNQIASSLLNSPPEDGNVYINRPEYNNLHHGNPDTILYHVNGSEVNNVVRPVDFNVQISSMQTKPTVPPATVSSTQKSVSTHLPIKPIFKPRPATTTPNYVILSTVTKNDEKETEVSSINSIINMLNDTTPDFKDEGIPADLLAMETKSSPSPITLTSSYTTPSTPLASYSSYYPSTGHYVTLKPTSISTRKPSTQKPVYDYIYTSPLSTSLSTSQAIDAFNKYPTDPSDFGDSVTTFSYISSSTTPKPVTYNYVTSKPLTTRKPPSTSYVTGASPTRRPVTSPSSIVSSYDVAPDNFASATPTVIVLNGFEVKPTEASEPQFIEISQEPFKKPVSQITVNNNIASTNNIYVAKPPSSKPQYDKPSSPTVVITPKPSPITTPYPIKASNRPAPTTTIGYDFVDFSPTTFKPEQQTSPDDLINFPPVRNPMLNGTGSNPSSIYNSSISLSDNELSEIDLIHEMEFSTPTWQEDDQLKEQMSLFVSKIVGSLQGTFQELHDIVILDKKQNTTLKTTTVKPKKTVATTKRPVLTTRKPVKLTTTTRKPLTVRTTKKPVRLTTAARRTTTPAPTTTTTTKKPVTTTKKKPTKKVTTTTQPTTTATEEVTTETSADNQVVDYNDRSLCGVRPLVKSGRIVGGKNARFGEWPWQVLVRESTWLGLFTKNKCGGVLISSRFVTTAAHCQPGFLASLVAVFGENDISGDKEPKNPVTRNVRRVIVHKDYDAATFENDLALLELDTPIKFDAHIVPICMPPDEIEFTGRMATVTGWGRLKYGGGVPAVLQEVQVPVIENSACQEMFQTAGHAKKILNSFICAGYANGQKDSCEGDSGGPLVLQRDDGRWQLVGTVSHGIKCAAPFLPGVYMRTTYYKPWLKSITGIH